MVQPVCERWRRAGRGSALLVGWLVLGGWSWVADASGTQRAPEENEEGAALFEPSDLSGTFMLRLNVATDTVIPVLGRSTVFTEQTMLATIERTEQGLVQHHDVCHLNAKSESLLAKPSFPQAFLDALPTKDYPLHLVRGADGVWEYAADLKPLYLGWDPTKSETIPREMDDPAAWDADEDGVPGVTVLLDVPLFDDVRVYMVQTGHTLLQGQVRGPDEVHGAIEVTTLEQRTIGASNVLFTPNPRIEPNNARSTFSLVRVEEGTTCSDLVAVNEKE